MRWSLIVYETPAKSSVLSVMPLATMRDVGYVLGESQSRASNFYHGMLLPRGALRYVSIVRT